MLVRSRTKLVALLLAVCALSLAFGTAASSAAGYKVSKKTATEWMAGYLAAWESRDADAVVELFTPQGVYQSIPGVKSETFEGREAIHKYWFDVTREQSKIHGVQGEPIVTGSRAAIEIWVTFRDPEYNPKGNHMITLLETNVVTFVKGGLASKNVEYWNIIPGVQSPPPGWGA
ncbi:MAG TPA: nuclear transport factor 2 family protein [Solirubrobacterales bacterium]